MKKGVKAKAKLPFISVVLAAGKGTRLKSAIPKVMHSILGKPLVYYPVKLAIDAGAAKVVCVVDGDSGLTRDWLRNEFGDVVVCTVQKERLGTAHALSCAEKEIPKGPGKVLVRAHASGDSVQNDANSQGFHVQTPFME